MKKIKWTILTLVILSSIGAAFATRPAKLQSGLYYWNGSEYIPVPGTMGQTWICVSPSSAVCCYTYAFGVYTPYLSGSQYTPIGIDGKPSPVAKKGK